MKIYAKLKDSNKEFEVKELDAESGILILYLEPNKPAIERITIIEKLESLRIER